LRCAKYAKSVKNWKRSLRTRLKHFITENGGWRNADILTFIQTDCNYRVYCANRAEYEETCRRTNSYCVQRVREDKFHATALAIQRCSFLACRKSRPKIEMKDVFQASDDAIWRAWREKHGIEEAGDGDGSGGAEGERPAADPAAAPKSPESVVEPSSESSDSDEPFVGPRSPVPQDESATEGALTKIADKHMMGTLTQRKVRRSPLTKPKLQWQVRFRR
jgi:hypothetical protein